MTLSVRLQVSGLRNAGQDFKCALPISITATIYSFSADCKKAYISQL